MSLKYEPSSEPQVSDALDNVRALVKHLKPQSCDGTCLEAMGRQMLAVFAMCGAKPSTLNPKP